MDLQNVLKILCFSEDFLLNSRLLVRLCTDLMWHFFWCQCLYAELPDGQRSNLAGSMKSHIYFIKIGHINATTRHFYRWITNHTGLERVRAPFFLKLLTQFSGP